MYGEAGEFAAFVDELKARKVLNNYECQRRRVDGAMVHLIENVIGAFDGDGELVSIKGCLLDDTERRRAQEELNQFFRLPLTLLLASDRGGTVRRINADAWERILGYRESELLDRRFLDFIHQDDVDSLQINDRCLILTEQDYRIVVVSGIPLAQYTVGDQTAESYAMVNLVEQGWASQKEVARAFGCSARSVRRYQNRMDEGGLPALGRPRGYPSKRPRVSHARERLVSRLKAQGEANKEIARRLGVTPKAIQKLLKRIGWHDPEPEQCCLPIAEPGGDPKLSAFGPPVLSSSPEKPTFPDEPVSLSFDSDPADRRMDRLLAYLGMLDDAAPLFHSTAHVPHGGVMLALPALVDSGIFKIARNVYGSIGPAFYGLRTTLITLLLMALLRIKRPESLKEHSPEDLGKVLGLDRAPEVKTLRRKLSRLAGFGRAADLSRALARKRVEDRGAAMGFLYVDGHVRVYHGKRPLPKAHVARRRLAMPATTDYWVNDMAGDPLFVVTAEANAGMVKMLPVVLEEVRAMVGERRITVVFDRSGFSPKLFLQLVGGCNFLSVNSL